MRRMPTKARVGEIRPSQMLYAFGIGSVVDLPNLSAVVMGLDDWDISYCREIAEERLLFAVREELGPQVQRLLSPPEAPEMATSILQPFDESAKVGIPVTAFPRWVVCPYCHLLAPLTSGLFRLTVDHYRPDRTGYVHENCSKPGKAPYVNPARFLLACERGHLDDFPWVRFVHRNNTSCPARLRIVELGVSGEAADVFVRCDVCKASHRMSDAFEEEGKKSMPLCRGRRPHLGDFEEGCDCKTQAILLGASNGWFPEVRTALSIPTEVDTLSQLVIDHWATLQEVRSLQDIEFMRRRRELNAFIQYSDERVWEAVQARQGGRSSDDGAPIDLRGPEWDIFSTCDESRNTPDFRLRKVGLPTGYEDVLEQVVLVERLREVNAFIGFTRIESPGDIMEESPDTIELRRAPISRQLPQWVPTGEVRGEGIFIQFREEVIAEWLERGLPIVARSFAFLDSHRQWRRARGRPQSDSSFPTLRYVLLHSFSHALMRQFSLECGYSAASIRERLYSLPPGIEGGPRAGLLLYTAAPDSEGTLGGLVGLGEPQELERHIAQALDRIRLCASDPLCSEHEPADGGRTIHGAACHACLFVPETSCERGNRYLDRAVLVPTFSETDVAFFRLER